MSSRAQVTAQIGGLPTVGLDVPICAVFIAIFVTLAASHMTILQVNLRRGHKFIFNGLCFGFSMSRIAACTFRLAWATRPTNSDLALVASVFLNAGIVLMYIINNLLAWRMVRSADPHFGWNRVVRIANRVLLWGILTLIVPLIVIIVLRVKKPSLAHIGLASKVVGRLAQTYFLVIATTPALLLGYAIIKARSNPVDPFGRGSWNTKAMILATSTALAMIEAGFRCGTTWTTAPLASDPAWWDSKAAFYCFNFMIDVLLLSLFLVGRIDRRFHVPNKADGPGSYSRETIREAEGSEKL
jgi:hypothetical protein